MFKLQMEDIQGTEFYCPLGYLLNLHTTERMSTFLEKLRCFFARLRSFDQIDGRIDPVKGEDSLRDEGGSWFSCFQKEPDAVETEYDKIWPPSPEELLELFYPADAVEQQKATVIGGPRVTLVGSKAAYNEAISMVGYSHVINFSNSTPNPCFLSIFLSGALSFLHIQKIATLCFHHLCASPK